MSDEEMTLNLSAREMESLTTLADEHNLSREDMLRQMLRMYIMIQARIADGDKMMFSADPPRILEFKIRDLNHV